MSAVKLDKRLFHVYKSEVVTRTFSTRMMAMIRDGGRNKACAHDTRMIKAG